MSDTWTERLSEYIDSTLAEAERGALEAHLAGCAACRTTLDELRRVVASALEQGRASGRLDSATVRVLTQSLVTIDSAIVQARRALAADPGSAYLNQHLADTMRRKLELLRRASALAPART